jgi:uncharacterized protein
MPKPVLRSDVLDMEDLKPGMILKGTVRNVIDFGAFVDIGVHQDGLVHVSQMSDTKFVKHPLDVVSVGDIVDVKVLAVDMDRKRISLTMKLGEAAPGAAKRDDRNGQKDQNGRSGDRGHGRGASDRTGGNAQRKGQNRQGGGTRKAENRKNGNEDRRRNENSRRGNDGGLDMSALLKKWS